MNSSTPTLTCVVTPFIIVKPEGLAIGTSMIEEMLQRANLDVTERRTVTNWPDAARELYSSLQQADGAILEDWLSTIATMYPAYAMRAEQWCIGSKQDPTKVLDALRQCKRAIREESPLARNLTVVYRERPNNPVRFSLIHTPDPNIDTLTREWGIINKYICEGRAPQ